LIACRKSRLHLHDERGVSSRWPGCSRFTYVWTAEDWFYVAVVIDLYP
jgi:transposase InsO family protein